MLLYSTCRLATLLGVLYASVHVIDLLYELKQKIR